MGPIIEQFSGFWSEGVIVPPIQREIHATRFDCGVVVQAFAEFLVKGKRRVVP
jgi:hypothetical protein